jgi:hypothetical protein
MDSPVYGSRTIDEISDPEGANVKKEITSIPSPFARIDLVKTAFKEVVKMANIDPKNDKYRNFEGKTSDDKGEHKPTIFHKMVAHTLDVAEIFFNIETLKDKFEIIIWDRKKDLDRNNVFGKTVSRYLEGDAAAYNFNTMNRIYMLNYIGPDHKANLNIVGATSPATLFFSSANDLSYIAEHVDFGKNKPFDKTYLPLHKREFEFQKYLYAFRMAYGEANFNTDFPEFSDYLITNTDGKTSNYKYLTDEQKIQIKELNANSINKYKPIGIGADHLYILNAQLHGRPDAINWKSDFEIDSKIYPGDIKPLVLPVEAGNKYADLTYTTGKWGDKYEAKYFDEKPWNERSLPHVITTKKYPYLTISDFLAPTIVCMPYKLNDKSFFDGNYSDERNDKKEEESYLLPLTDTFFRFFTVENLQGTVGAEKMFELIRTESGIKAILRIPIANKRYIEYSRIYFDDRQPDIEKNNDGAMIEKKFGLGILPLISFPEKAKKHYHIALFDRGPKDVSLTCYTGKKPLNEEAHIVREAKDLSNHLCSIESYVITENFDRIKVTAGDVTSVIIPKFRPADGSKIYTFAVDFGTTNSHIEYSVVNNNADNNRDSTTFDILPADKQMHRLHEKYSDLDIQWAFDHNLIPDTVTDNAISSFPIRTAFAEWSKNNRNEKNYAMANGNIPFLYEKRPTPDYNNLFTDLKWRGEEDYPLIKLYLENIFLLLRNKVVCNGGNLEATKIIWFYPASMDKYRYDYFGEIWKDFYKKYFGNNADENLISISESAAPHRYYRNIKGAKSNVVTIDVGGGTTDVYVVENDQPRMLLSFLFASNDIFGDAFNWNSDSNGFVTLYYEQFLNILNTGKKSELAHVLKTIANRKKSTDIVAFLFSLYTNKETKGNDALDFVLKLSQNRKLKYVFVLFYGAILYYIAKTMKAKSLQRPLTLAFSGNGSKTLRILSPSDDTISKYAKLIFDGVYGTKSERMDIIFEDEPKKATCKGGVLDPSGQTPDDIKDIKITLIGDDLNNLPAGIMKFKEIPGTMIEGKIVNSVIDFVDFLFKLHEDNDKFLTSSLGADEDIIEEVKAICKDRVEFSESLKSALSKKKGDKEIEETLFFYPLIGVLHKLAQEISKM